ncbi:MAG: Qat anti-phage system TatD family nuclease QatD [Ginsengibacter sp.]
MNELVDFHCHLDLYNNFEQIVTECDKRNVFTLAVTTTPRAWLRNYELAQKTKHVRAALGLHPQLINNEQSEIGIWEKHFLKAKYIGEVGLDASPRYYPYFEHQQKVFDRILSMCSGTGGKVLSIHSVRCVTKVLESIVKNKTHLNNKIVLHWFTGSLKEAHKAIEVGCYFSVNLAMFQSHNSKKIIEIIPKDRILTETDGPFTSYNNKPQHPWNVDFCIESLAIFLGISKEEMQSRVYRNLMILLQAS